MDWIQVLTIVAATIGSTYGFFLIVRDDMKMLKEDMIRIDEKWENRFLAMDEKWERLFEKLLIKEKVK